MAVNTILSEDTVNQNPILQFDIWYKEHLSANIGIPNAFSLGTARNDRKISLRTVLLKDYGENGFVFFTNYNSKKGFQLAENPNVAVLFYWSESGRQVRIEGTAEKISPADSDSYFSTRPRESQISAWASKQSTVVPGRQHLEEQHQHYSKLFSDRSVERPPNWGGIRINPGWFEFWQNDERRLHDRITYSKRNNIWVIERLAP